MCVCVCVLVPFSLSRVYIFDWNHIRSKLWIENNLARKFQNSFDRNIHKMKSQDSFTILFCLFLPFFVLLCSSVFFSHVKNSFLSNHSIKFLCYFQWIAFAIAFPKWSKGHKKHIWRTLSKALSLFKTHIFTFSQIRLHHHHHPPPPNLKK